jgi:L-alanine-DL-glutamate epimerase-like enolase superfamily enzyme
MTVPQGVLERSYMKDRIRIAQDGYVYAPTKPGLGYEIDRNEEVFGKGWFRRLFRLFATARDWSRMP